MKLARASWRAAVLAGAVAAASVAMWGSSPALAQYQVGQQGRASDASNQIGAGGYNGGMVNPANQGNQIRTNLNGNQIITGNVTGGRAFRGFVPYADNNSLRIRGMPGTGIDRFVQNSYGVPQRYGSATYNQLVTPRSFYGMSQVANVPEGYSRNNANVGFVPFSPQTQTDPGDLRLNNPLSAKALALPPVGLSSGPGEVDPSAEYRTALVASPLYGLRYDALDNSSLTQSALYDRPLGGLTPGRTQLDDASIQRMRDELRTNVIAEPNGITPPAESGAPKQQGPSNSAPQPTGNQPAGDASAKSSPAAKPAGLTPSATPLTGQLAAPQMAAKPLSDQVSSGALTNNIGAADQSLRQNIAVPAAIEQSAQYAELRRRLDEFNKAHPKMTDAEANRQMGMIKAQVASASGSKEAGTTAAPTGQAPAPAAGSSAKTGTPPAPGQSNPAEDSKNVMTNLGKPKSQEPAKISEPFRLKSFAEGVKAKGLHDMLVNAEDLMRQGKFSSAIDKYDEAEDVAPNNPLVWMGRACAELGASYYARAEQHLRQAFTADPSLLMAQYDLKGFYNAERLAFLVKDLKEIAVAEPDQPRPAFLLAFIAYNTEDERKASGYLDLAEKRSGGKDPVLTLLREHWTLPTGPDNSNKPDANK